jgi:hypothetical protein
MRALSVIGPALVHTPLCLRLASVRWKRFCRALLAEPLRISAVFRVACGKSAAEASATRVMEDVVQTRLFEGHR